MFNQALERWRMVGDDKKVVEDGENVEGVELTGNF